MVPVDGIDFVALPLCYCRRGGINEVLTSCSSTFAKACAIPELAPVMTAVGMVADKKLRLGRVAKFRIADEAQAECRRCLGLEGRVESRTGQSVTE